MSPSSEAGGSGRRAMLLAALVLALATLAAYSNSFRGPFVYDDVLAIAENPTIRKLWPLSEVLVPQLVGGVTSSGRPLVNLSFALNHALSGDAVWSYHAFNLLIHLGAGLALFGVVRRTLLLPGLVAANVSEWNIRHSLTLAATTEGKRHPGDDATLVAFVVALLWLLHPLHTESVTYLVQRAESLMGFFFLLTFYCFVRAVERNPIGYSGWSVATVAACLAGMATKEVMATAPLLVLLYDRTFVAGSFRAALRARLGLYAALAATWLLLGALVFSGGGNRGGTVGFFVGVPWWKYTLTQFQAISRYLALGVWPRPLVFEYGTFWVERAKDLLPHALVVLPLLVGTIVALWRRPALGFCGAWFFVTLAPTSLTPGTIQMIVEHRTYLALAGLLAALAIGARAWLGRPALVGAAVVAVIFGGLTFRRNFDYRSAIALWSDTVEKHPENPRAHGNLADVLGQAGRFDDAIREAAEAVRLKPDEAKYRYNLGLACADAGRFKEAIEHYEKAMRLGAADPSNHNNLAVALVRVGRAEDALPHYAAAARLKPDDAGLRYNHGVALARAGQFAEAAAEYEAAVRLRPDYADARFNLGTTLIQLGRPDAALAQFTEAVHLKPADLDYCTAFGNALLVAGRIDEAAAQFRTVLAAQPDAIDARFGFAGTLVAQRQPAAAVAAYEAVLQRAPDHGNAHFALGNLLIGLDRVAEAARHYERAVQLRPNDAEAHHNLGIADARLERWSEARAEFETALRLKPDYPEAQHHLDQLRGMLGR